MTKIIIKLIIISSAFLVVGCASTPDLKHARDSYADLDCEELKKDIAVIVGYQNKAVAGQGLNGNNAAVGFFFGGIGANLSNEAAQDAEKKADEQKKFLYSIFDEKGCSEKLYRKAKGIQSSPTQVASENPEAQGYPNLVKGTGFLFSSSNFVITNYHLVKNSKSIIVKLLHGQDIKAEVVAIDKNNDIAFLKLDSHPSMNIGKIDLGDSAEVRLGDKVFTIGYPLTNILGSKPKYSEGVINALSGVGNDPKSFQISIPIQPGNSGGPLFNDNGDIIGIVTSSLDAETTSQISGNIPQNVNFAIKSVFIKNLLPTLPEALISPTGVVPVPVYSENNRSSFVNQIKNNIVLLEIEN
jgi:S1-C subfamily serine protease